MLDILVLLGYCMGYGNMYHFFVLVQNTVEKELMFLYKELTGHSVRLQHSHTE